MSLIQLYQLNRYNFCIGKIRLWVTFVVVYMAGFRGRKSPRKETLSLGTSKIFENFDNSLELRSTKFPGHHFVSFAVDVSTFYHRLKRHFMPVPNVICTTSDVPTYLSRLCFCRQLCKKVCYFGILFWRVVLLSKIRAVIIDFSM